MTLDTILNHTKIFLVTVESRFSFIASEKNFNLFLDHATKYL